MKVEAGTILLWLDDVRRPPEGWQWVKTVEQAKAFVLHHAPEEMSLDHDLGATEEMIAAHGIAARGSAEESGMTFVTWLIEEGLVPKRVTCHSWSPAGAGNMAGALKAASDRGDAPALEYLCVEPYGPKLVERLNVESVYHSG